MSATPAIHFLRAQQVPFTEHPYRYEERGGTTVSSRELGVDERKKMPVYMERTIADLERIYINGGRRGFLIALAPEDLVRALSPTLVDAAQ